MRTIPDFFHGDYHDCTIISFCPYRTCPLSEGQEEVDAVIALGCVIQGETRHFDYVCQGAMQGLMQMQVQWNMPIAFGVLTVDTQQQAFDRAGGNLPAHYLERWTGPGSTNSMPRMPPTDTANGNWTSSDLYVQNGAYLRLRSLQVGYTIPEWITKKALVSRLRVYFMAENLLTITKYRGFDPEVDNGVDVGLYPQARTLSVGVNLAF